MAAWIRLLIVAVIVMGGASCASKTPALRAASSTGEWHLLRPDQMNLGAHHLRHERVFGEAVRGTYNERVLAGIDRVQASAMDGGGYFIGVKAVPAESPIGYNLALFNRPLLQAPRTTSYCSGASYSAFIEGMNLIFPDGSDRISDDRLEALRMQELDGGRREDRIKYWGKWNDDGFGSHYALVQYSGMGTEIEPIDALPGDFMNISWTNGGGHAVVFLGWRHDAETGEKGLMYWASQGGTNGLGDQLVQLERIRVVKTVRLTAPERIFDFDVDAAVDRKIPGSKITL